jgi:signal transduction histidine kinase
LAQWSLADRTLYAKLVYYGPALGGKTTNLRVLHRVTDPEERGKLVSVNTADDRTLFFDLLPFDLGSVLGFKVAMKLYTVPGQVHYDATRRAVLAGADAVVFVADSEAGRREDNRLSWENLRQNMRAARLDPTAVPILVQLNKRDLPAAAPQDEVERWLGVARGRGVPAIARDGSGVLETFLAAAHAMLGRLVAMAEPQTRRSLEAGDLAAQLDAAFAPFLARAGVWALEGGRRAGDSDPLVLPSTDVLESAVAASAALGAQLADEHGRAARLTREAESLRRLSDVVRATGASFERAAVVDAALTAAMTTLDASGAALAVADARGRIALDRGVGRDLAPLAADREGASLLARMLSAGGHVVVDDLGREAAGAARAVSGVRAIATIPVDAHERASLLVAVPEPDGAFGSQDVRFLATLAGHLAVGLEKLRIHNELRAHRDRLEEIVRARTRSLRRAYDELRSVETVKDRFLSNVSHEMRSPLTAIIGAASFLKDYRRGDADEEETAAGILVSAHTLVRLVDDLLRVAGLEAGGESALEVASAADIVAEAMRLAASEGRVQVEVDPCVSRIAADPARLARAVGNLLDNAMKFGPPDGRVGLGVAPCVLGRPGGVVPGVAFSVTDRGPGIPEEDVERAFAPFEQGGDPLTEKPGGVGLGLYEARAIVRRHGGTLIYLPRPGGGSEFRISLPTEAVDDAGAATERTGRRA